MIDISDPVFLLLVFGSSVGTGMILLAVAFAIPQDPRPGDDPGALDDAGIASREWSAERV